jgi:hypothetical protein
MKIGWAALALTTLMACGGTVTSSTTTESTAAAVAAEQPAQSAKRPPPPAVAFDACAKSAVGDACEFTDEHGSHEGACIDPPNAPDDQSRRQGAGIVCLPNDAPKCDH